MSPLTIALIVLAALFVGWIFSAGLVPYLPGTMVGSGIMTTQHENFANFTAVSISDGFKFTITQSDSYGVSVTIDNNLVNYVQFTQAGNTLSVGLSPNYSYQSYSAKVDITMPDLSQVSISGGSTGMATGFSSSHDCLVSASGGSTMTMSGSAGSLSIEASGGSQLNLGGFQVTNVYVDISGGSEATVSVSGSLDGVASGGSQVFYLGNPTSVNVSTSGGSAVSKG